MRVGIVAWNVAEHLARCLTALPGALDDLDATVVVVDNASDDDSAGVAAAHGAQVLRSPHNEGYARGMNRAFAGADEDVLVALNPDTVPAPGSLRRLIEELDARPDVAVVGPLLRRPDGRIEHSANRFPSTWLLLVANLVPTSWLPRSARDRLWLPGATRPSRTADVDWLVGAVHVLRRVALPPGPYRERWFLYAEDVDLCWRLTRTGWRSRFVGAAEVVHVGGASAAVAGDRGAERWAAATYDWYRLAFGPVRTRLWAVLNAAGEVRLLLGRVVGALLPGGSRRRPVLGRAAVLRHHLRAAFLPASGSAGAASRAGRAPDGRWPRGNS